MIRYEETPEHVFKLFKEIQTTYFPELRNAKISILYDLKKSSKGGKVQLGCIKRPNDLIRHFSKDEAIAIEGYDYIIILDKVCFENVSERDRERILRHELRHTYFDIDTEDNPYRLVDHDITDFYAEIELNKDDPRWGQRCASLTADIYEQMKEEAKDAKKRKREYDIHPKQMTIPDNDLKMDIHFPDGETIKDVSVSTLKLAADVLEARKVIGQESSPEFGTVTHYDDGTHEAEPPEKKPLCLEYDPNFICDYLSMTGCTNKACCQLCPQKKCSKRCEPARGLDEIGKEVA